MSSQGFSFPPPPPPPSTYQQTSPNYQAPQNHHPGQTSGHGYQGSGARGTSGGNHRGRGRGGNAPRGSGRGAHFRPQDTQNRGNAPPAGYPPTNYNTGYQNPNPNQSQFHHPSPSNNYLAPQTYRAPINPPQQPPHYPPPQQGHPQQGHPQQAHNPHQHHGYTPRPHPHPQPYPQQSSPSGQPVPVPPRVGGGYQQQPAYHQYPPQVPTGYNAAAPLQQHGHMSNAPRTEPPVMGPPMRWGFEDSKKLHPYTQDNRGPRPPVSRHSRDHRQSQSYRDRSVNPNRGADKIGKHGNNSGKNKRPHSTAFGKSQNSNVRVPAPPPVPMFGNPLPSKPPAEVDASPKPKKKKRRRNQLGLTPQAEEHESSEEEDDADEETKLAQALGQPNQLQFTYKGQTSTLKSSSEIAAWIQERKNRFPTMAKVEARKKELEEKKRAAEEAKKARMENEKEKLERKAQQEATDSPEEAAMKAKLKAEKLRRRLIKEERRIARAEADAEKARLRVEEMKQAVNGASAEHGSKESTGGEDKTQFAKEEASRDDVNGDGTISTTATNGTETKVGGVEEANPKAEPESVSKPAETQAEKQDPERPTGVQITGQTDGASSSTMDNNSHKELDVDSDDSSISISSSSSEPSSESSSSDSDNSSSEDDEDSAPEAMSSKRQGPERVAPPPRQTQKKAQICRRFQKRRCPHGKKCKWSHEIPERSAKAGVDNKKTERKGLLQALIAREREEENRHVMEAIKTLGEGGVLDEPTPAESTKGPDAEISAEGEVKEE